MTKNQLADTLISSRKKILKHINAKRILRIFIYLLLLDLAFVFLYPFLYMLITSLKSPQDINDVSVKWIINQFYTNNYALSWRVLDYPSRLLNTVGVVLLCTVGHVLSCSFVGYGMARYNFWGKKIIFIFLLLSMIVPMQTIIAPIYMLFVKLNWVGTALPIIIPSWLGFGLKGALFVFIFRQFYLSLPSSLEEAAQIDGCGPIRTFFSIALPASRSSLMVCIVLSIVWHWNDYFEPMVYITSQSKFLLPMMLPGLYSIVSGGSGASLGGPQEDLSLIYTDGVAMAATVLVVMPIFIIYMFLQKQFIQGVERSGITGE